MKAIEGICEGHSQARGDALAAVNGRLAGEKHPFLVPIPFPFRLPTPVYGAMLAIWHLRPVLQRRFPLHRGTPRDFVRFLAWCASEGRRQYAVLREIPDWDVALSLPVALPHLKGDRWANGYSVAMFLYGVAKHHYRVGPMLRDAVARDRVARAYWRGERHKRLLPPLAHWQGEFLAKRFGCLEGLIDAIRLPRDDLGKGFSELGEALGLADVGQVFDGGDTVGRPLIPRPDDVLLPPRLHGLPLPLPLRAIRPISRFAERFKTQPTEFEIASITSRIQSKAQTPAQSPYPFGVNLFGYAKGEIGIGEDVRLVALALKAQNIPFCIVNVQPGANVSQQDTSAEQWVVSAPRYAINIFCITGIEQTRYACEQGLDVFRDRYTIGLWPWELPHWPTSWGHAYNLVDEIWGISRYTASAYWKAPRPVYAMSLPVTVDMVSAEGRAHFGLPANDYLFVFSFDLNSTLSRKNPAGVVRAFQRAFPRSRNARVGLVLKASHVSADDKAWMQLKATIDGDPRIHLIEATLRRPQVLALYRCCDCYISLHRAEGFGRGLAEALLLDLQLVATGFSGNLDFCSEDRVGLVRFRLRELKPGEYFHSQGQHWAEPDIDHAAEVMYDIYSNPRKVMPKNFDFSPAVVGRRYAKRLREIQQELRLREEMISC